METLPPTSPAPTPEPEKEKPEEKKEINLDAFADILLQDRYSGSISLQDTLLLDIAPRIKPLLSPIHLNLYRTIWSRYGNYNKISRSQHDQLRSIVEQYAAAINPQGNDIKEGLLLEQVLAAIVQAKEIEQVCEAKMDAFRQHQRGNLHFVKKVDPKPEIKKRSRW